MLTVPFIGISILAHISIIIFYTVFHLTPRKGQQTNNHKIFNKIFGSIIIITVFSFVSLTAFSLVRMSVEEKHSTIVFLRHNYVLPFIVNAVYTTTIKVDTVS